LGKVFCKNKELYGANSYVMATQVPEEETDASNTSSDDADALDAEQEGLLELGSSRAHRAHSKTEFHPATVSSTALAAATNYYLERGASAPDEEDVFGARLERQVFGIGNQTEDPWSLGSGHGRRGRQRGRRPAARLAPELEPLLAKAHLCFLENDLDEALQACHEVIVKDPKAVPAYKTLSLIHGLRGEKGKALDYALIAAHLNPLDASWWKRIAGESILMGKPRQAIHCLTKALRAARGYDWDALRERAYLYLQIGDDKRAAAGFEQLLRLEPQDEDAVVCWARILLRHGEAAAAESLLSNWLDMAARRERIRAKRSAWEHATPASQDSLPFEATQRDQRVLTVIGATGHALVGSISDETRKRRPLLSHVRVQEALADAQLAQGKAAEVVVCMSRLALLLTAARITYEPLPSKPSREANVAAVTKPTAPPEENTGTYSSRVVSRSVSDNDPERILPLRLRTRLALAYLLMGDPLPARQMTALLLDEEQVPFLYFHDLLYHFQQILERSTEHELETAILKRLLERPPYHQDAGLLQRFQLLSKTLRVDAKAAVAIDHSLAPVKRPRRMNSKLPQPSSPVMTLSDTERECAQPQTQKKEGGGQRIRQAPEANSGKPPRDRDRSARRREQTAISQVATRGTRQRSAARKT
jgi:tetratricopeptide (TPR) repeat protein